MYDVRRGTAAPSERYVNLFYGADIGGGGLLAHALRGRISMDLKKLNIIRHTAVWKLQAKQKVSTHAVPHLQAATPSVTPAPRECIPNDTSRYQTNAEFLFCRRSHVCSLMMVRAGPAATACPVF
jgi:hypothetical protein